MVLVVLPSPLPDSPCSCRHTRLAPLLPSHCDSEVHMGMEAPMLAPRLMTAGPLRRTAERQLLHALARRQPPGVVLVVACLLTTVSAAAGTHVQSLLALPAS
jgi:hypothetical protein